MSDATKPVITGPGWYERTDGLAVEVTHFDVAADVWRVRHSAATGYLASGYDVLACSPIVRRLYVIGELPPPVQGWVHEMRAREIISFGARAVLDLLLPLMPSQLVVGWRLVQDDRGNDEWHAYVGKDRKTTVYRDWKTNRPVWGHGLARGEAFDHDDAAKADVEKRLAANGGAK